MLVEVQMDRMGSMVLRPVSERVRAQMRRHNKEWTGHSEDTVLIQREDNIDSFMERHVPPRKHSRIRQGWPEAVRMDPWDFGHYVGYDFQEVINP